MKDLKLKASVFSVGVIYLSHARHLPASLADKKTTKDVGRATNERKCGYFGKEKSMSVKNEIATKNEEIFRLREEIGALYRKNHMWEERQQEWKQREQDLIEEICATKRKYVLLLERHIEMMERKVRLDDQM